MIKLMPDSESRYKRINLFLISLIILTIVYIVALPFAPQFYFWMDSYAGQQDRLQRILDDSRHPAQIATQSNRIIVPDMLLDAPVTGGANADLALSKGAWHWPPSSTPDKAGNTVLIGKRFTHSHPKEVFYFLDRLKQGDDVGLIWNGSLYHYSVTDIKVVPPADQSPAEATDSPTLTLYSSTTPWLPTSRLVVTAQLKAKP